MFLFESYRPISMSHKNFRIFHFRDDGVIVLFYPWSELFVIGSLVFFMLEKCLFEEIARTDHVNSVYFNIIC